MTTTAPAAQGTTPQMGGDPGLLDWIVKEYLGTKIQSKHIANQAGANMIYTHGLNIAQRLGVDTSGITPFPAPTNISIQQPARPSLSGWQQVGLSAAMLGAGAALGPLGSAAVGAIGQWIAPAVQDQPQAVDTGKSIGDVGIKIE